MIPKKAGMGLGVNLVQVCGINAWASIDEGKGLVGQWKGKGVEAEGGLSRIFHG